MEDTSGNPVDVSKLLAPSRGKEESMEEYRHRRYCAHLYTKVISGGKTFHDSRQLGTYRKPKE